MTKSCNIYKIDLNQQIENFSSTDKDYLKKLIEQYPDKTHFSKETTYTICIDDKEQNVELSHSLIKYISNKGYPVYRISESLLGKGAYGQVVKTSRRIKCHDTNIEIRGGKIRLCKIQRANTEKVNKEINFMKKAHDWCRGPLFDEVEYEEQKVKFSYMWMKELEGPTVGSLYEESELEDDSEKLNVILACLRELKRVHDLGIYHRDPHWENFKYLRDENTNTSLAKLFDFGESSDNPRAWTDDLRIIAILIASICGMKCVAFHEGKLGEYGFKCFHNLRPRCCVDMFYNCEFSKESKDDIFEIVTNMLSFEKEKRPSSLEEVIKCFELVQKREKRSSSVKDFVEYFELLEKVSPEKSPLLSRINLFKNRTCREEEGFLHHGMQNNMAVAVC